MPVDIEAVLALLPELFPGVQKIPLKAIRPNPENPGPPITEEQVQELTVPILEDGLVNPLKLRPDPTNPLAAGVKPHSDNPRIKADGTPWKVEDFNWMILSGERRWRVFNKLQEEGWTWQGGPSAGHQATYRLARLEEAEPIVGASTDVGTLARHTQGLPLGLRPSGQGAGQAFIPAFILNPTEEEAVIITHTDNDIRDRGWFADYQSIECLIKANPNQTQRQIGAKLKMDIPRINKAFQLLPLLNPETRVLIVTNCNNSNKGIWGIAESAAARLADLGPGTGFKPGVKKAGEDVQKLWPYPAISAGTQDLVWRALEVAVDQEMTEAGVKGLVSWIKDGGQPEKYQVKGPKREPEELEAGGEEDQPIPWSEASKHPEYRDIPLSRVRVNSFIENLYAPSGNVEQRARAMQSVRYTGNLKVRRLSVAEKETDPDHDYELFDDFNTFEGAQWLGWESLPAQVYDIDEWEAVRLHNMLARVTFPKTWIQVYGAMEKLVQDGTSKTVAEAADSCLVDPAEAERLFPVLKLLNEATRDAIHRSIRKCYEGCTDQGGYRFCTPFVILLGRLEGAFKTLEGTQKLVERVVNVAIENEIYSEDLEELVDWALAGNAPEEFYEKVT